MIYVQRNVSDVHDIYEERVYEIYENSTVCYNEICCKIAISVFNCHTQFCAWQISQTFGKCENLNCVWWRLSTGLWPQSVSSYSPIYVCGTIFH